MPIKQNARHLTTCDMEAYEAGSRRSDYLWMPASNTSKPKLFSDLIIPGLGTVVSICAS